MLTIGRDDLECDSFKVKGSYGKTIARLFSLPVAVESTEPLTLEVTLKGNFRPPKIKRRVYWKKKFIGDFIISSVAQEWDGNRYRTRLELKQCDRTDAPDEDIPAFKWRHDLIALSQNLPETDGALIAAGRTIDPFANSWKLTSDRVDSADDDIPNPAVLPVAQGGTGASDPRIALLNLGGVDSATVGLPFGVAPLGADGKVPIANLPPLSGGGGSNVTFPITVAQGGTNALDAATARANLGAISLADLPPFPSLGDLGGVSTVTFNNTVNNLIPIAAIGAASGVAPLGGDSLVPASFLPAYPTLSSLGGLAASSRSAANGVAPLGGDSLVPASFLPAYPTLSSLGGLAASSRNAVNGVAGLDTNSLLLAAQIPSTVQFSLRARSGATAIDLNTQNFNHAFIRWLDGGVTHVNVPPNTTAGAVIQYDPLNTLSGATDIYKLQTFFNYGRRVWDRYQSNGSWATWAERAYLDGSQPFTSMQQFNASARFLGGTIPPVTTTLTQGGTNAEGLPVYWLVNASATAGNRLKSITISNNGNIRFTHHADDGTAGNVLEHTASGNILTNGTVRPGSGSTAFTGAQFVSGSTYFRTDLLGDSGVGMLTYSDGSVWRRITNGSVISSPDPGIFDLTNNQTAAGNKTFTGKTQFGLQTANFTNASTTAGVGTSGEDAIFSLHCSGVGLGVFGFDFSASRFVIGSNAGKQIDFCTNVGGTPNADNLLNATAVMRIIGSNIVMINLPTSSAGLSAGMVWRNGNVLNVV